MNVLVSHNSLHSPTLQKINEWINALGDLFDSHECPFDDTDELATRLEIWREEYQSNAGAGLIANEKIKVMTYGNEVILICKEETQELIKLTVTPCPMNTEMS